MDYWPGVVAEVGHHYCFQKASSFVQTINRVALSFNCWIVGELQNKMHNFQIG